MAKLTDKQKQDLMRLLRVMQLSVRFLAEAEPITVKKWKIGQGLIENLEYFKQIIKGGLDGK